MLSKWRSLASENVTDWELFHWLLTYGIPAKADNNADFGLRVKWNTFLEGVVAIYESMHGVINEY